MNKAVGKRILAAVLCVCMLAGLGHVSSLRVKAEDPALTGTLTLNPNNNNYTGEEQKPRVLLDGVDITDNSEYQISFGVSSVVNAGSYTVTVTKTGTTGALTTPYLINKRNINTDIVNGYITREIKEVELGEDLSSKDINDLITLTPTYNNGKPLVGVKKSDYDSNALNYTTQDFTYEIIGNTVNISGINNYMTNTPPISNDIPRPGKDFTVNYSEKEISYYGEEKKDIFQALGIQVVGDGENLEVGKGYNISYYYYDSNNAKVPIDIARIKEAGTYYFRIEGSGNYKGTNKEEASYKFKIVKDINQGVADGSITIKGPSAVTYTGQPIIPVVEVKDGNKLLVEGTDYELFASGTDSGKDQGGYTIVGKGVYTGTSDRRGFDINPIDLYSSNVEVSYSGKMVYNGQAQIPAEGEYTVIYKEGEVVKDITEHCTIRVRDGEDNVNQGTVHYVIYAKQDTRNYVNEKVIPLVIERKPIDQGGFTIEFDYEENDFTGDSWGPTVTVWEENEVLDKANYQVTGDTATNANQYTLRVTGVGNYIGELTKTFSINPAKISNDNTKVEINGTYTYNGKQQVLNNRDIVVTYTQNVNGEVKEVPLIRGKDYTIVEPAATDYINAGVSNTVWIEGMGNYSGKVSGTFEILPKSLKDKDISVSLRSNKLVFNNKRQIPEIIVNYNGVDIIADNNYSVLGDESTNVRNEKYNVTITGMNNFTDSVTLEYEIVPRPLTKDILKVTDKKTGEVVDESLILKYAGEGNPVTPDDIKVICTMDGEDVEIFEESRGAGDYKVEYEKHQELGKASLKITGINNYGDTAEINYFIKGDISDNSSTEDVDIKIVPQYYTGSPIDQEDLTADNLSVSDYIFGSSEHIPMILGQDFEIVNLDGQDYINAGTKEITIQAKAGSEKYIGSRTIEFEITPRKLQEAYEEEQLEIDISSITYTGKPMVEEAVKNGTEIKYFGTTVSPEDYEIRFAENEDITNAGKVKVIIEASDSSINFEGSIEVEAFEIDKRVIEQSDVENGIITTEISKELVLVDEEYVSLMTDEVNLTYTKTENNMDLIFDKGGINPEFTYHIVGARKDFKKVGECEDNVLLIQGNTNFEGTVKIPVTVKGNITEAEGKMYKTEDGEAPVLEIKYDDTLGFGEIERKPPVTITYRGVELTQVGEDGTGDFSVDYTGELLNVTPEEPEEGKTPTITITGAGYYSGSAVRQFKIVKCNLAEAYKEDEEGNSIGELTVTGLDSTNIKYNKKEWKPLKDILNNGVNVTPGQGSDYFDIEYNNNTEGGAKDKVDEAGNRVGPSVTITAKANNPNYEGSVTIYFTIYGRDLSTEFDAKVVAPDKVVFNGAPQEGIPKISVLAYVAIDDYDKEYVDLTYKKDFLLRYEDNVNAGTHNVTIIGINNYAGELTTTFTIDRKEITDSALAVGDYKISIETALYSGSEIIPEVTLIDNQRVSLEELSAPGILALLGARATGVTLVQGTDYTVTKAADNIEVGAAAVTITGIGNYTGDVVEKFDIEPLPLDNESITVNDIESQFYQGTEIRPSLVVTLNGNITLQQGKDYEVIPASGFDNINVPLGKVTIIPAENNRSLTGTRDVDFTIAPKDLMDRDIEIADIENQALTDGKAEPKPVVQFVKGENEEPITLTEGIDYTVSYENNTDRGRNASVIITGVEGGNYTGTKSKSFVIAANINDAKLAQEIENQIYDGKEKRPEIHLVYGEPPRELKEGRDYAVKYVNNIEAGTATIIVQGSEAYGGTKEFHFNITRGIEGEGLIEVDLAPTYIYTGHPIEPTLGKVLLKTGETEGEGIVLEKDKDYTLSFENNTAVGEATMTVNGIGYYSGKQSFTFNITHKSVAQCTVSGVRPMTYDGKPQKPTITVVDAQNAVQLQAGTDYNVVYLNNNRPGEARVIVSGKGNYTGNQVLTYKINLPNVSGVGAVANSSKKATLTWTLGTAVTGYEIYDSDNVLVSRNNRASYIVYGLTPETEYGYKIRSYVIVGGQIFYSGFTNVSVRTN